MKFTKISFILIFSILLFFSFLYVILVGESPAFSLKRNIYQKKNSAVYNSLKKKLNTIEKEIRNYLTSPEVKQFLKKEIENNRGNKLSSLPAKCKNIIIFNRNRQILYRHHRLKIIPYLKEENSFYYSSKTDSLIIAISDFFDQSKRILLFEFPYAKILQNITNDLNTANQKKKLSFQIVRNGLTLFYDTAIDSETINRVSVALGKELLKTPADFEYYFIREKLIAIGKKILPYRITTAFLFESKNKMSIPTVSAVILLILILNITALWIIAVIRLKQKDDQPDFAPEKTNDTHKPPDIKEQRQKDSREDETLYDFEIDPAMKEKFRNTISAEHSTDSEDNTENEKESPGTHKSPGPTGQIIPELQDLIKDVSDPKHPENLNATPENTTLKEEKKRKETVSVSRMYEIIKELKKAGIDTALDVDNVLSIESFFEKINEEAGKIIVLYKKELIYKTIQSKGFSKESKKNFLIHETNNLIKKFIARGQSIVFKPGSFNAAFFQKTLSQKDRQSMGIFALIPSGSDFLIGIGAVRK